jgi:hypothetical protein
LPGNGPRFCPPDHESIRGHCHRDVLLYPGLRTGVHGADVDDDNNDDDD